MKNDPVSRHGAGGVRVAATALVVAVAASVSVGQVQRVDMGRAMDANPQVGAGGSNRPVQGYVPINGNEIISGNVSGLKYFHGTTGTNSPYEFRGSLGSSTLNNFARQSAGGSTGGSPLGESFYLPSRTLSTGQGSFYSSPLGGGFDSQYVPQAALNPSAPASRTMLLQESGTALNRTPQAAPLTPGSPGAVLNSPLFLMRSLDGRSGLEPSTGERSTGILRAPGTLQNSGTPQEGSRPLNQDNREGPGVGEETPGAGEQADRRINATPEAIRNARVGPRDTPPEDLRISPVYRDLLAELRKSEEEARQRAGEGVATGGPGQAPGGRDARGSAGRQPGLALEGDRDPLTGLPRPQGRGRGGAATRPGSALTARGLQDLPDSTLRAGGTIPELRTLVQPRNDGQGTTMDMLLARAEQQLKEGRYLDAATTYEQSLLVEPENALALVGKAHAELGAGAYQSAAYDLKFVFTRNPQMVGVKYNMATFINSQRQDFLIRDLSGLGQRKEMENTSSFLLCYLYYQTGRMQQLRSELQKWGSAEGRDTWQAVLRRAWLVDETARPVERTPGG